MGILQGFFNLFGRSDKQVQFKKDIVLDPFSPVEKLFSKKEMKELSDLVVSGPIRGQKIEELFTFLKGISQKHNNLKVINLSKVVGMEEIPAEALKGCSSIKEIHFPGDLKLIQNEAFSGCSNLERIIFEEGLERILEQAFAYCPKLSSVILPQSLFRLGKEVFMGDDSIESIVIPSKVESIGTGSLNCKNLRQITVEPHNPSYIAIDNVLYSRNGSALVKYANNNQITDFVVPETVAKIVEDAFSDCSNLKNITFSKEVNLIGDRAFKNCKALETLHIPARVEKISDEAFCNCTSLNTVTFENGIAIIGTKTFYNCTSLKEVTLPKSLAKVGDEAFAACSKLEKCELPISVESPGKNIFSGTLINK